MTRRENQTSFRCFEQSSGVFAHLGDCGIVDKLQTSSKASFRNKASPNGLKIWTLNKAGCPNFHFFFACVCVSGGNDCSAKEAGDCQVSGNFPDLEDWKSLLSRPQVSKNVLEVLVLNSEYLA